VDKKARWFIEIIFLNTLTLPVLCAFLMVVCCACRRDSMFPRARCVHLRPRGSATVRWLMDGVLLEGQAREHGLTGRAVKSFGVAKLEMLYICNCQS